MSTRHCLLYSHERNLLAVIARAASPSLPPHGWRSGRLFMSSLRLIRKGLFAFQKPLPRLSFLDFVQRKERSTFAIQVDSIPNSFRIAYMMRKAAIVGARIGLLRHSYKKDRFQILEIDFGFFGKRTSGCYGDHQDVVTDTFPVEIAAD